MEIAALCALHAHGPPILPSGLRPSGSIGGPWADNAALGHHNVSLGRYIFPYPSGRDGTIPFSAAAATNARWINGSIARTTLPMAWP